MPSNAFQDDFWPVGPFQYQRHQPENTLLYQLVKEHWPQFQSMLSEQGRDLLGYVVREFEDYLKCGRLEHGFLRVKCESCHHEKLVAFSCKRRGFCPSCGGRRMADSAAHLVDEVLPKRSIRQWVLSGKVLTLQAVPTSDNRAKSSELVSKQSGFSMHAGVACKSNQRKKLERLCRYIMRPAIAEQRLSLVSNGNVVAERRPVDLKTPYDDGTSHLVLSPMEFMGRLAALVPKPRVNLTRFHGVFSPRSRLRVYVVPDKPEGISINQKI